MLFRHYAAFALLACSLLLFSCKQEKQQRSDKERSSLVVAEGNGWQGLQDFHAIEVSGVSKVVVFIRDSTSVKLNDEDVMPGDRRVSIEDGVLTIAPADTVKEHRINNVRIYTPRLDRYVISDCSEANLSGDTLGCKKFLLDIHRCNIFRGNACIICSDLSIGLQKMLMAKFDVQASSLSLKADSLQHVELKGTAKTFTLDCPDRIKPFIDTSKLKTNK